MTTTQTFKNYIDSLTTTKHAEMHNAAQWWFLNDFRNDPHFPIATKFSDVWEYVQQHPTKGDENSLDVAARLWNRWLREERKQGRGHSIKTANHQLRTEYDPMLFAMSTDETQRYNTNQTQRVWIKVLGQTVVEDYLAATGQQLAVHA
jgi:hypothetical protein